MNSQSAATRKAVWYDVPGGECFGVWQLPHDGRIAARSTVVICHSRSYDHCGRGGAYTDLALALATVGISSLRFDCRGRGNSQRFPAWTLATQADDTQATLAYAREENGHKPVALLGAGEGGYVAALAASRDNGVRSLILWEPDTDPSAAEARRLRKYARTYPQETRAAAEAGDYVEMARLLGGFAGSMGTRVDIAFFEELRQLDGRPLENRVTKLPETLVLQPRDDELQLTAEVPRFVNALRDKGICVEMQMLDAHRSGFWPVDPRFIQETVQWLSTRW